MNGQAVTELCDCGKPATWAMYDNVDENGVLLPGLGLCDDQRDLLLNDNVRPTVIVRLNREGRASKKDIKAAWDTVANFGSLTTDTL